MRHESEQLLGSCFYVLIAVRALTSLQKTMGFAAPANGGAAAADEAEEDVEMVAEGALPAEVEAKIMETNQA